MRIVDGFLHLPPLAAYNYLQKLAQASCTYVAALEQQACVRGEVVGTGADSSGLGTETALCNLSTTHTDISRTEEGFLSLQVTLRVVFVSCNCERRRSTVTSFACPQTTARQSLVSAYLATRFLRLVELARLVLRPAISCSHAPHWRNI